MAQLVNIYSKIKFKTKSKLIGKELYILDMKPSDLVVSKLKLG